jgi:hypothetical protein
MVPRSLLLLLALASLLPASASTLEGTTAGVVAYQFDGGSHHDAPDMCGSAGAEWALPLEGSTDGLLVPPDDMADVFLLDVPRSSVGSTLLLSVLQPQGTPDLSLTAFAPGCAGSVLDLANWPAPEPSPPAPAPTERQHGADLSSSSHCSDRQWLFVIDGLQGVPEPASIHVAWTDATEATVPLYGRYGSVAVYSTPDNLGILLKGAWANLAATWAGSFFLAAGPCDAVDGGAVYGSPPLLGDSFLAFTPVRAGQYVIHVGLQDSAVGPVPTPVTLDPSPLLLVDPEETAAALDAEGLVHDPLAWLQSPPEPSAALSQVPSMAVPATCHICLQPVEGLAGLVSYVLSSSAF